ncbi:MAG: CheR family methyltransferase [Acidimicrobiia bacterium]
MALSTAEFEYVRNFVQDRTGVVLQDSKEYLVEARLGPLAREVGLAGISEVIERLRHGDRTMADHVVDAMTTNETSFFRDGRPFDALREGIIPALMQARANSRRLSIWCGAAASGQEPYSLAMLLRESFPQLSVWNLRVLCTDVSPAMIARCKEACFAQIEVNRGLSKAKLQRWFDESGAGWRVRNELRVGLEFRVMNLLEPWPGLVNVDLVMLRNVLIYFDQETKFDVLERVRRALTPDGFLMLGAAESTLNTHDGFKREMIAGASVYRPIK